MLEDSIIPSLIAGRVEYSGRVSLLSCEYSYILHLCLILVIKIKIHVQGGGGW
jgi:hypothetical protein